MNSNDPVVFRGGRLGNFAPCPLQLTGPDGLARTYPTVEHYFQAHKTLAVEEHDSIVRCATPAAAKQAGRRVPLRGDWEDVKQDVMRTALRAKFESEPFRSQLLRTEQRQIIEESDRDLEWGARRSETGWDGANLLGRLLMQVREELLTQVLPGQQLHLIP